MNHWEAWGLGLAIGVPCCFAMGYFASRQERRAREREYREFVERMDELTRWPDE